MSNIPVMRGLMPVIVVGNEIEQAIDFYQNDLGFTLLYKEGEPVTMAMLRRDYVRICLKRHEGRRSSHNIHLRVAVENIQALFEEFRQRKKLEGLLPSALQFQPWGSKEFTVPCESGVAITFHEFQH